MSLVDTRMYYFFHAISHTVVCRIRYIFDAALEISNMENRAYDVEFNKLDRTGQKSGGDEKTKTHERV